MTKRDGLELKIRLLDYGHLSEYWNNQKNFFLTLEDGVIRCCEKKVSFEEAGAEFSALNRIWLPEVIQIILKSFSTAKKKKSAK